MSDDLIDGLSKHFNMVEKPADMPIEDFFKVMRKANQRPLDISYVTNRYPDGPKYPYVNGTIWGTYSRAILTYLGCRKDVHPEVEGEAGREAIYVLLGFGTHIVGGGVNMLNAYHWEDGSFLIRESQLKERLKDWKCLGFWDGVEWPEVIEIPAVKPKPV